MCGRACAGKSRRRSIQGQPRRARTRGRARSAPHTHPRPWSRSCAASRGAGARSAAPTARPARASWAAAAGQPTHPRQIPPPRRRRRRRDSHIRAPPFLMGSCARPAPALSGDTPPSSRNQKRFPIPKKRTGPRANTARDHQRTATCTPRRRERGPRGGPSPPCKVNNFPKREVINFLAIASRVHHARVRHRRAKSKLTGRPLENARAVRTETEKGPAAAGRRPRPTSCGGSRACCPTASQRASWPAPPAQPFTHQTGPRAAPSGERVRSAAPVKQARGRRLQSTAAAAAAAAAGNKFSGSFARVKRLASLQGNRTKQRAGDSRDGRPGPVAPVGAGRQGGRTRCRP